ncbi:hypothetical protein QJS66_02920 [Kocuria rhizophila]|nr:hypothetical protein QJS66_02920 [Kocuria rhizophila]
MGGDAVPRRSSSCTAGRARGAHGDPRLRPAAARAPIVAWWPARLPGDPSGSSIGRIAHRRITTRPGRWPFESLEQLSRQSPGTRISRGRASPARPASPPVLDQVGPVTCGNHPRARWPRPWYARVWLSCRLDAPATIVSDDSAVPSTGCAWSPSTARGARPPGAHHGRPGPPGHRGGGFAMPVPRSERVPGRGAAPPGREQDLRRGRRPGLSGHGSPRARRTARRRRTRSTRPWPRRTTPANRPRFWTRPTARPRRRRRDLTAGTPGQEPGPPARGSGVRAPTGQSPARAPRGRRPSGQDAAQQLEVLERARTNGVRPRSP